jgi:hypothetical protein
MLLDFDPEVVGYSSQPFWLRWHDGRRRRHAPDFFVRLIDGTGVVVDVPADDRIEVRDAEAFAATERACTQVGWRFRRVGVLDPVFAANVRWLAGYRHPRCYRQAVEAVAVVGMAILHAGRGVTRTEHSRIVRLSGRCQRGGNCCIPGGQQHRCAGRETVAVFRDRLRLVERLTGAAPLPHTVDQLGGQVLQLFTEPIGRPEPERVLHDDLAGETADEVISTFSPVSIQEPRSPVVGRRHRARAKTSHDRRRGHAIHQPAST